MAALLGRKPARLPAEELERWLEHDAKASFAKDESQTAERPPRKRGKRPRISPAAAIALYFTGGAAVVVGAAVVAGGVPAHPLAAIGELFDAITRILFRR
jgi:hypothetical protein